MKQYDSLFGWPFGSKTDTQNNTQNMATTSILGVNGAVLFNPVSYDNLPFCAVIKDMKPGAVRVPGGMVANDFNPVTGDPSPGQIANLYSVAGCKIFIVLNMLTSTLEDQIAWLNSLNLLGVPIRYIELGNEFPDTGVWLNKYQTAQNFAAVCRTWMNAILAIFPDAAFGVPAGNRPGITQKINWNKIMLGIHPDINLVHHYHNSKDYTLNGVTNIFLINQMVDADYNTAFAGIPTAKIWATEINVMIKEKHVQREPIFKDEQQKGIAAAAMLKEFKCLGYAVALYHNIVKADVEGESNGAIYADKNEAYLTGVGVELKKLFA